MANELRQRNEELGRWRTEHEADLAAAHATQQVLIPARLPTAEGWSIESIYQPMIEIGGDILGWRPLGDGRWHLWVVDATGHGAAAALLTSLAAQLFRQACETEQEPAAILGAVNREFRQVFRGRAFMTGCCALIDPQGALTFSGAGHPPLLVRRANGNVDAFGPHGTLLGLKDSDEFEESRTTLEPGDAAVLYSDGLFAFKRPDGERFSPQSLREVFRAIAPGVAFFDRLLTALHQSSDGESCSDDTAAIALQRR
jgi:sigma-B regulation protein RsbU (phosphoserine phosphatase)